MPPKTAVIIGGGIAGCSTAYALAQRGIGVTLLERHADFASEASGNTLAMLYPRLSGDDTTSQFALAGYLHSLRLLSTLNLDVADFNACGLLQLGFNARELARIKKVAVQNHPANIVKYVTACEASRLSGIQIAHDALYFPSAAWIKPKNICMRLLQHKNISIITLSNTINILKNNDLFEIHCKNNLIVKADIAIIANANNAKSFSQSNHITTQAVHGQVSQLTATAASHGLKTIVCSNGYLSPAVNHQHSLGATFSIEPSYLNEGNLNQHHNDLALSGNNHQKNLEILKLISEPLYQNLQNNIAGGRVALRCTTPDYFPLVGELLDSHALKTAPPRPTASTTSLPWLNGLYINVAHGSKGFTSAPLCAELLACLISNAALPIPATLASLLNPNRFILRELGLKRLAKTMAVSS